MNYISISYSKGNSFLLLLLWFCFTSCTEVPLSELNPGENNFNESCIDQFGLLSENNLAAAETLRYESTEDFDWENKNLFPHRNMNAELVEIPAPWSPFAETAIPRELRDDYLHNDGWRLVYNMFTESIVSQPHPKLILYNIYRGVLRVYYYRSISTIDDSSLFLSSLIQVEGFRSSALNLLTEKALPVHRKSINPYVVQHHKNLDHGMMRKNYWYLFDFKLSYDPSVADVKMTHAWLNLRAFTNFTQNDSVESGCSGNFSNSLVFSTNFFMPGAKADENARGLAPHEETNYPLGLFTISDIPKIYLEGSTTYRTDRQPRLDESSYELIFNPNLLEEATITNRRSEMVALEGGKWGVEVSFIVNPNNGSNPVEISEIFAAEIIR
jgi:hypothetical protein